jgi:hypothetical protein
MALAGLVRAEGAVVTSAGTTDKILIQKLDSNSGQFEPREITVANLLANQTGDETITNGNLILATAGKGLQIKTGSNARMGTATLASGTVTIANTSITANTLVFLSRRAVGASTALGLLSKGTVVASTSFVINALKEADATVQTNDVSQVEWLLIEPAA